MDTKEIVIEPVLTEEEEKQKAEAMKVFGRRVKEAFKRAPMVDCGIFSSADSDDDDEEGSEEDDNSEE